MALSEQAFLKIQLAMKLIFVKLSYCLKYDCIGLILDTFISQLFEKNVALNKTNVVYQMITF